MGSNGEIAIPPVDVLDFGGEVRELQRDLRTEREERIKGDADATGQLGAIVARLTAIEAQQASLKRWLVLVVTGAGVLGKFLTPELVQQLIGMLTGG